MGKKTSPAFDLPGIQMTMEEVSPFTHKGDRVVVVVEVLTLNFNSGSMRVRLVSYPGCSYYNGNIYDCSADRFFEQLEIIPFR